jgi:hypothetical protein
VWKCQRKEHRYILGSRISSLNAKIQKGSIEWSERRVKLSDCVEQKNCTKIGNAWEKKYAEFESYDYDGMPERGTQLYLAAESVEYQD